MSSFSCENVISQTRRSCANQKPLRNYTDYLLLSVQCWEPETYKSHASFTVARTVPIASTAYHRYRFSLNTLQ